MNVIFNFLFENYWSWFILGLALMILEVTIPGIFFVWIGIAAVLMGFVAAVFSMTLSTQFILFAIFSFCLIFVGYYGYKRFLNGKPADSYALLNAGAQSFVGNTYKVVDAITMGQGKVKVGDTVWIASCPDDVNVGEVVRVIAADGIILNVKKEQI